MNLKNFLSLPYLGILTVLFFLGAFLGYLCCALFFDNAENPPSTHQISLTTTLETESFYQDEKTEEREKRPTILTKEEPLIEKVGSEDFPLEKPILDFLKSHIDLEDFSISKISQTKYQLSAKIPEIKRVTELIPSLKNYTFFIKPFVGKNFIVYVNIVKKSPEKIYCEIEKMKVDRFFIRKNMIKSFISFADFEINIPRN